MIVRVTREMVQALGESKFKPYGVEFYSYGPKQKEVDLSSLTAKRVQALMDMAKGHESVRGVRPLIKDCEMWLKAIAGGGAAIQATTVKQFTSLLLLTISKTSRKHIYNKADEDGIWDAYYVAAVDYHPPQNKGENYIPATCTMKLVYTEMDSQGSRTVTYWAEDCVGMTAEEALARSGWMLETEDLRKEYERRTALYNDWVKKVGKQFLATGVATDDLDGNDKRRDNDRNRSWYWRSTKSIVLDRGGEPAHVVIDVFHEGEERTRDREVRLDMAYWAKVASREYKESDDEREPEEITGDVDADKLTPPEVPLHHTLACFDLKRHLRLRIDVGQLQPYAYDPHLGDKLVLPEDSRNLVEMLLAHKGGFKDIVAGKSGGAIILCAGVPGTGKTLTAEVYAEVMAKPLYTVQASQLGTDPDELEDELLRTFARAARWGAILLLDEADVYIHARGDDLVQNAIVGVFLRVLEYYKGVLFLTTNRSDLVDDAIASRCVARIDYTAPVADDQRRIWEVLSETAGITISDEVIRKVVARFPNNTGRDVKNLLKLAKLVADSRDCEITEDVIRFVKRFKPTVDREGADADKEPITLPPMATEPVSEPEPVPAAPAAEDAAPATQEVEAGAEAAPEGDWRSAATAVFADGAPHSPAEVREAVAKVEEGVHPNAVTNHMRILAQAGKLERLPSGLYRKVS